MKQIILLLLMALMFGCTAIKIKEYQNDRAKWKGIIYEGIGVDGVMLGDSSDMVKSLLGKPEFVWINKSSKHDFIWKYMFIHDQNSCLWQFQDGCITLYLTNQKKIVALSDPLFDYSYVYYGKGITILFDEYDRVVEIIVFFKTPIHRMEIKNKVSRPVTEYKPYTGRFWYGNIAVSNTTLGYLLKHYKKVLPQSEWGWVDRYGEWKERIFVGKSCPFYKPTGDRRQTAIYFINRDVNDPKNKVMSLVMYSPMTGIWIDRDNPFGDGHPEEAIERRKKYIKKYGYKYY